MINRNHSLSLVKQCQTLALARSGFYYQPRSESDANLKLMRLIDEIHLKRPYLGIRRIKDAPQDMGHTVNRKHVQRLMRKWALRQSILSRTFASEALNARCIPIYSETLRSIK